MNFTELKRWPLALILLIGSLVQYYFSILNVFQSDELCWRSISLFYSMTSCQRPLSDISTVDLVNGFISLFPLRGLIFAVILYLDKEGRLKFVGLLAGLLLMLFGDLYIGGALVITGILPYLIQILSEIKEYGIKGWHIAAISGLINFYIPLSIADSGRHCQGGCDMVGLVFVGSVIYFIIAIIMFIPVLLLRKDVKTHNDLRLILLFGIAEITLGIFYALSAISTVAFNATLVSGLIFVSATIVYLRRESQGVPYLNYVYLILGPLFIFGTMILITTSFHKYITLVSVEKNINKTMDIEGIIRVGLSPKSKPIQTLIIKNDFILPVTYSLPEVTTCLHDSINNLARGYNAEYYKTDPRSNPIGNSLAIGPKNEIKIFLRGYEGVFYTQQGGNRHGESDEEITEKYDELLLFYNVGMNNYGYCDSLKDSDINNAERVKLIK